VEVAIADVAGNGVGEVGILTKQGLESREEIGQVFRGDDEIVDKGSGAFVFDFFA